MHNMDILKPILQIYSHKLTYKNSQRNDTGEWYSQSWLPTFLCVDAFWWQRPVPWDAVAFWEMHHLWSKQKQPNELVWIRKRTAKQSLMPTSHFLHLWITSFSTFAFRESRPASYPHVSHNQSEQSDCVWKRKKSHQTKQSLNPSWGCCQKSASFWAPCFHAAKKKKKKFRMKMAKVLPQENIQLCHRTLWECKSVLPLWSPPEPWNRPVAPTGRLPGLKLGWS